MTNLKSYSPREAYAAYMLGSVLVDVRDGMSTKKKDVDVKQIVRLPFSELDQRFGELPPDRPVVIVSGKGSRGMEAAKFLLSHGYHDVAILEGGMVAWEQEGFPVR
ncbi:MAG: rhodanese-like domain-containing protein [Saprospiraceae bacterium]|nr:rhodanese-like domain-containing protein [Saprospiraceae bacterium]